MATLHQVQQVPERRGDLPATDAIHDNSLLGTQGRFTFLDATLAETFRPIGRQMTMGAAANWILIYAQRGKEAAAAEIEAFAVGSTS